VVVASAAAPRTEQPERVLQPDGFTRGSFGALVGLVSEVQTCTSCFQFGNVFVAIAFLCHMHNMTALKLKIINSEITNTLSVCPSLGKPKKGRRKWF